VLVLKQGQTDKERKAIEQLLEQQQEENTAKRLLCIDERLL
jgi:hypothetical protein